MTEYLFVGGPLHGTMRAMPDQPLHFNVMSADTPGDVERPEQTTYVRRAYAWAMNDQRYGHRLYSAGPSEPRLATVQDAMMRAWLLEHANPIPDDAPTGRKLT